MPAILGWGRSRQLSELNPLGQTDPPVQKLLSKSLLMSLIRQSDDFGPVASFQSTMVNSANNVLAAAEQLGFAPPRPTTILLKLSLPQDDPTPAKPGHTPRSASSQQQLPPVSRTLPLAEIVHRTIIGRAARGRRIDCPELTGQNCFGQPLSGPHRHAYILPLDADRDGFLDHVLIHSPMGLGSHAVDGICGLRTLFASAGTPCLHVRLASRTAARVANRIVATPPCSSGPSPIGRGAFCWTSVTPFVPPRFVKRSGRNTLAGQVLSELASRELPPAEVEILDLPASAFRGFVLARGSDHAPPPQRCGYALRLTFATPVIGPIALGYASHFGMGLFETSERS